MIIVVQGKTAAQTAEYHKRYAGYLFEMHRQRYAIFAEFFGWKALQNPLGLDVDRWDSPLAGYVLCVDDEDGRVLASMRIMPMHYETMLHAMFDEQCDKPLPQTADCLEVTRTYSFSRSWRNKQGLTAAEELHQGFHQWCLENGVKSIACCIEISVANLLDKPGRPKNHRFYSDWFDFPNGGEKEGTARVVGWDINADEVAAMQAAVGYDPASLQPLSALPERPSSFVAEDVIIMLAVARKRPEVLPELIDLIDQLATSEDKDGVLTAMTRLVEQQGISTTSSVGMVGGTPRSQTVN